jgi:hypothetical protein
VNKKTTQRNVYIFFFDFFFSAIYICEEKFNQNKVK